MRRLRLLAGVLIVMHAAAALVTVTLRILGVDAPAWLHSSALAVILAGAHERQIAGIALGAAMIAVTRMRRLAPQRVLAAGLIFQILAALIFSTGDVITRVPGEQASVGLPQAIFWMMVLPLVPATTRWSARAAFGAFATGPLVHCAKVATGHAAGDVAAAALFYLPLLVAAVLTVFVSRVVHGLAVEASRERKLGSYSLVEKIAEGAMGEVWKARHASLIRPAAVKLIRPEYLGRKSAGELEVILRRFEREAQATALLSSPHTVALYDFGRTQDGVLYYVMELLGGINLADLVDRFGPLPAERAVFILEQICHSLDDAHRVNLVHRDIKPENVQLTVRGREFDFAKVLDFGLVKRSNASAAPQAIAERVVVGTAAYMAPEAALDPGAVDARSDIYSLGCLAYAVLSGQVVFDEATSRETMLAHIERQPVPLSQRVELPIPRELEELVHMMLAKEPGARPADADEVRRRLAAIPLAKPWTQERAEAWWRANLPDKVVAPLPDSKLQRGTIAIAYSEAARAMLDGSDPRTRGA